MLLVVCLCLTLLNDPSQYAILNARWLRLTLDAQVEEDSVRHLYLNLLGDGVTHLFCRCRAISWGVLNFLPALVDLTASICFCLLAFHNLLLGSFLVHGVLAVACCLFHSMQILSSHQTICSVNSEVVSKFDAAKVIRFSLIKSSSRVYNGSSHFGTIPLFILGV